MKNRITNVTFNQPLGSVFIGSKVYADHVSGLFITELLDRASFGVAEWSVTNATGTKDLCRGSFKRCKQFVLEQYPTPAEEKKSTEVYTPSNDSDELNPEFLFNLTATELLVAIASGKIDAVQRAKQSLASRGIGVNGKWVGFDNARREWNITK